MAGTPATEPGFFAKAGSIIVGFLPFIAVGGVSYVAGKMGGFKKLFKGGKKKGK